MIAHPGRSSHIDCGGSRVATICVMQIKSRDLRRASLRRTAFTNSLHQIAQTTMVMT